MIRNAVARSSTATGFSKAVGHTVPNILACQRKRQPMVSGVYTYKAMNKRALTDRCHSCLYIGCWMSDTSNRDSLLEVVIQST